MTGVIIAGGVGSRLRPLTHIRPKPMVPVVNKPLLQYQVELLKKHGIRNIIFCVGRDISAVEGHFGSGDKFGVSITYSIEKFPLGTAGAVGNAVDHISSDWAVVLNGDGLIDYDLSAMIAFHIAVNSDATIGLAEVPSPTPCGVVDIDPQGRVFAFKEPDHEIKRMLTRGETVESTGTAMVNTGIYVISRQAVQRIPSGIKYSMEKEFFPGLITDGCSVYGYKLNGYWIDIGSPKTYLQAHHDLLEGKVDAVIPGETNNGRRIDDGCAIDPTSEIHPETYIGPGTSVGPRVRLSGRSSIGPGCTIDADSVLDGCVILDNVTVGKGCILQNCIIDRDCTIGDGIVLADNSIVAAGSNLLSAGQRCLSSL